MKGCVAEQKVSDWQMNAKTLQTVIWRMTSIRLIGFAIRWEVNEVVKKFGGGEERTALLSPLIGRGGGFEMYLLVRIFKDEF